jgi:hypothetical protein
MEWENERVEVVREAFNKLGWSMCKSREECVTDMLTDLQYFAAKHGINFDARLATASDHYFEEHYLGRYSKRRIDRIEREG